MRLTIFILDGLRTDQLNCSMFQEKQKKKGSSEGMRKSRRLADLKLQEGIELHLSTPRARVGIGPAFQADVPEWTGSPTEADISSLCYLGITLSPEAVEQTISGSRRG